MDLRKIQSTGGSSYSIILPKKWIIENKIDKKDGVFFDYNGVSLIIRPEYSLFLKKELIVEKFEPENLKREIIAHYLSGVDKLTIKIKNISQKNILPTIKETILLLIGFEIRHSNGSKIEIIDIYNSGRFYFIKAINEMVDLSINMYADAVDSFITINKEKATFVLSLDKEVNRIYFHIRRNFNRLLEGRLDKEGRFFSLLEIKFYEYLAIQLERIADHAVKISGMVVHQKLNFKTKDTSSLIRIYNKIFPHLQELKDDIKNINKDKSHDKIKNLLDIEKELFQIWPNLNQTNSKELIIFLDSINRLRGYLINIHERVVFQCLLLN